MSREGESGTLKIGDHWNAITKIRYIARLFAKELVLSNFTEATKGEL